MGVRNLQALVGTWMLMFGLCISHAAHAQSFCGSESDRDKKSFCRAMAGGQASYCASISDADYKNYCKGRVYQSTSHCGSIGDRALQLKCRDEVYANKGTCGSVRDSALRNYCHARASADEGRCASVSSSHLRIECRAILTANPSFCSSISDRIKRGFCQEKAKRAVASQTSPSRASSGAYGAAPAPVETPQGTTTAPRSCTSLPTSNERSMCLAIERHQPALCDVITDAAMRAECLSKAK